MSLPMPFDNPSTYPGHVGIDFPQPKGTIVRASGKGRVTKISFSNTGGWRVWIKYDSGTIKYVHMDSRADILVNVGDEVEYGQPIARVGKYGQASGNIPASTGYHLHIENGDESGADAVWKIVNRNEVVGEEMLNDDDLIKIGNAVWGHRGGGTAPLIINGANGGTEYPATTLGFMQRRIRDEVVAPAINSLRNELRNNVEIDYDKLAAALARQNIAQAVADVLAERLKD